MIWFHFLAGLAIGMLTITIGALVIMFQNYLKYLADKNEMYDCGFEHGRDWKKLRAGLGKDGDQRDPRHGKGD